MKTKKNVYLMQVTSKKIFGFLNRTFKTIFFAINVLMLLLLLSSFFAWSISPDRATIFAYLGLGFPAVLLVNILFVAFWLFLRQWKFFVIDVLVMLACYRPIITYFPLHIRNQAPPAENTIKVLSYNVRGFNWQMDKIWSADNPMVQYLRSIDADIICMQEYMASTSDKHASTKNLQKVLEKYPYYSVIPLRSTRGGYEYGLACFSKYPIKSILRIPIVSKDNGSALYQIDVKGKIISVINNHLESNRLTSTDKELYRNFFIKSGEAAPTLNDLTQNIEERLGLAYKKRAPQVDLIAHYIQGQKADAVIVCGDFNDCPISYSYKTICETLVDSYAETGFGPGITYHENHFWFRIDYIMHSKNMKAYDFSIGDIKYSDHYPVWTILSFK
jgi:endonuclease/exonuclease/phosphatase family metal-dependent hydrolase